MGNSPLADVFTLYDLMFAVPVGAKGTDAVTGNPTDSNIVNEIVVQCTLRSSSDPRVLSMVGADGLSVALSGRCVEPMALPEGLRIGSTASLIVNGIKGTFKLGPTWPSMVPEIQEAVGDRIIGAWRAGAVK